MKLEMKKPPDVRQSSMASSPKIERARIPPRSFAPESVKNASRDENTMHEMARYRMLVARTVDAFGDEIKASRWLSLPNKDFNGQTPLQAAQKKGYDPQVIEPNLSRIEHGVEF
jgi:uncharacterized protein (DUF2384 family)